MPTTRTRPALRTVAAATLLMCGVLGGCSVSQDDEPAASRTSEPDPTPTPSTEATPSASATPSAEPTPSASPSAAPTPSTAPSLEQALLTAAQLPKLNSTSPWTQGETAPVRTLPFGLCQKFDLPSIGAEDGVDRLFRSRGDAAEQQVVEFGDAQTALRASKVVEAWRKDCAGRVRAQDVKVRPFTDVAVAKGRGSWYLASYTRRGEGHFHSLGMVVSGPRMTLIRMDHDGQDHNYGPGKDPMELAVKAAAAKLG
jgi:hypothetical protein